MFKTKYNNNKLNNKYLSDFQHKIIHNRFNKYNNIINNKYIIFNKIKIWS